MITWQLSENNTKLLGVATHDNVTRTVIEVKLFDDGSGSYRFEIFDQLDDADAQNENDIKLEFHFTATDSDGDKGDGHFKVLVDDDVPVALNGECAIVTENPEVSPGKDANFVLVLDTSASIDNSQLNLIKANAIDFLNQLAASGAENIRVHLVDFDNNSAVAGGTYDIKVGGAAQDDAGDVKGDQLQNAIDAINALVADGSTNFEAGLAQAKEWIEGGTLTVTNSHVFNADTVNNSNDDDIDNARVLVDVNDVRIAIVSAWDPSSTLDDVSTQSGDGISGGFGVNGSSDQLDSDVEVLRFDFGAFNDFDGAGEYARTEEAVGFRGSDIVAATFVARNWSAGDPNNLIVTVHFVGSPPTSQNFVVAPWNGATSPSFTVQGTGTEAGKLISYIEFKVPSAENNVGGYIDLETVTLPVEGPIPAADENHVIFLSDGEPNRELNSDGSVSGSIDDDDALDATQNEITAIETAIPGQAFTIDAFGINASGGGISNLNEVDTGNSSPNITTNNGLSTALASLIASLGGGPAGPGSSAVIDLDLLMDVGADEEAKITLKTDVSSLESQDITSGGVELTYVVVGNVIHAYKGAQIPANEIFTVTFNPVDQHHHLPAARRSRPGRRRDPHRARRHVQCHRFRQRPAGLPAEQ